MVDFSLHQSKPHPLLRLEARWKAFLLWKHNRQADAELRAAIDRLAALSPHYLDDIGVDASHATVAETALASPVGRA